MRNQTEESENSEKKKQKVSSLVESDNDTLDLLQKSLAAWRANEASRLKIDRERLNMERERARTEQQRVDRNYDL